MSGSVGEQNTGIEPVHVQLPEGKRVVYSINMDFTKALRHYSDNPESAYKLLCDYASHAKLDDGTLLDIDHAARLKSFVESK
ncbi:hypothetical protein [Alteromonas macleodii]|jgi:hypothetical protein|uniref:hypothetical protein n=1 Tax=Pseudoalteromonas lipolytica TaxID=570156 RepID=UPI002737BB8B|nr:hypothetical protein [Alteromonas macleodii]